MYIVDHVREEVVNVDNAISIGMSIKGAEIIAGMMNGETIVLGHYCNRNRAREVFDKMLEVCFPPNAYLMQNCDMSKDEIERAAKNVGPLFVTTRGEARIERYDVGVYYMPEI